MTSEALELALGHQHTFEYSRESDHIHRVSGRKRRTLHWTSSNRPLHVSQVEVREAKGIKAGKRALLVLYGDAVALLSGSVLESSSAAAAAAGGGGGEAASDHVPALRFLEYSEVISIIPRSSDSIEIEHVVAEDKPKLAIGNLLEVLNEQQQQQQQSGAGSESDSETSSSSNAVIVSSSSSNNISSSSTVISAVSGSTRVTYATLVLGFHNAAAAQAAAAALLYYQGQAAAAVHWLSEGLHLGFKCQLAAAEALPLSSSSSRRGSTMWRAVSIARRSSAGHGGSSSGSSKPPSTATNLSSSSSSSAVRYQWICQPGLDWGCQVPLPQHWEGFVTAKPDLRSRNAIPSDHSSNAPSGPAAAAAARAGSAAAEKDITLDDLMCRSDLDHGPQALVISFTTPYGLAQATVTPQIVRAAVLNSECRQVLAMPVSQDSSSSSSSSRTADQAAPVVGFPLKITARVGSSSSSSSSSSAAGIGSHAVQSRFKAAAAAPAAAAAGSSVIDYESQVYAALTIQVVQTPQTAGIAAAVRPLNPYNQPPQQQQQQRVPAIPTPMAAAAPALGTGSSSSSKIFPPQAAMRRLGSRMPSMAPIAAASGLTPRQLQLTRLSLYILLAALFCSSSSSSSGQLSGIVLLQLLVLLLVAAADLAPLWQQQLLETAAAVEPLQQSQPTAAAAAGAPQSHPSKRHESQSGSNSSSGITAGGGVIKSPPTSAFAAAAVAEAPFIKDQTPVAPAAAAAVECPVSAGWSLILIEGDVTSSPGPFLQLQIAALSCDQQTADLRAQLSTTRSGSVADLAAPAAAAAAAGGVQQRKVGQQLPMLLSEPEPAWLDEDTKVRFINAKPTLEASRMQAAQTDEWRRLQHVDTIFNRPAPFFDTIEKLLPFYTLDKTDEGHAVLFVKLGALKQLSDAVFVAKPPVITLDDLEMHLTLINEYLTKIAAPGPLPAGNQVLLFDLGGMKLSHVMNNEAYALFQVLLKFGTFYPEHLHQAIIMHAPAWFNIPWKMVATFLDANTRSKIMVIGSPKSALKQLTRYLRGVEHVPVQWGGQCTTPLDEFPAHEMMLDFVAMAGK